MRDYIGEVTCIATKTIIIPANTKKEALQKLKNDIDTKGIDVNYGPIRAQRIVGMDKVTL